MDIQSPNISSRHLGMGLPWFKPQFRRNYRCSLFALPGVSSPPDLPGKVLNPESSVPSTFPSRKLLSLTQAVKDTYALISLDQAENEAS